MCMFEEFRQTSRKSSSNTCTFCTEKMRPNCTSANFFSLHRQKAPLSGLAKTTGSPARFFLLTLLWSRAWRTLDLHTCLQITKLAFRSYYVFIGWIDGGVKVFCKLHHLNATFAGFEIGRWGIRAYCLLIYIDTNTRAYLYMYVRTQCTPVHV